MIDSTSPEFPQVATFDGILLVSRTPAGQQRIDGIDMGDDLNVVL